MKEWNLGINDPLTLDIAADARLVTTTYTNDHIWEMDFGGIDPAALSITTTFGLRARWLRLFPSFRRDGIALTDPLKFYQPPQVKVFYPNYLKIVFRPYLDTEILAEYWVAASQVLCGRLRFQNTGILKDRFTLNWSAILSPLGNGFPMETIQKGPLCYLQGKVSDLAPVCYLTGGPQPQTSPYNSLSIDLSLNPGTTRQLFWALASLPEPAESLELARRTTARAWDGEIARLELLNTRHTIDVETGDPAWNAAFALSQKNAQGLVLSATRYLPNSSFVLNRIPEQGFSSRGDGSDYPHLWGGQTPLDALFLSSILLPASPAIAEGLLSNFLHVQEESGFIDWKPGLGNQRSHLMAQPLLATLAENIDICLPDHSWLSKIFPALFRFIQCWFDSNHDRDQDSFPEWQHPLQSGYDDNPLYSCWSESSTGMAINYLESPGLAAMLFREVQALIRIGRSIGEDEPVAWLGEKAVQLRQQVEASWDSASCTYRHRDYLTHLTQNDTQVCEFTGSGIFPATLQFQTPHRLVISIFCPDGKTCSALIRLKGETTQGTETETISPREIRWTHGNGRTTTQQVYTSLTSVEINGLSNVDHFQVKPVNTAAEDVSLLLPLWAGIPDEERAGSLIRDNLLYSYLGKYGIPNIPAHCRPAEPDKQSCVNIPLNQMLGEGLLDYGYRQEAADLVTRLMNGIVPILRHYHGFRQQFDADNCRAFGEYNHLHGLAPLHLFLRTLGLERITANEIIIEGLNPFPWPVTVKYRGISIFRNAETTRVTYPTGQTVLVSGVGPHVVALKF